MNEYGETLIPNEDPGAGRRPKPENRRPALALHLRRIGTCIRNVGPPVIPGLNPPFPVIIPIQSLPEVFWSKDIQTAGRYCGLDPTS